MISTLAAFTAGLLTAGPAPVDLGTATFRDSSAAVSYVSDRLREQNAKPTRVCYNAEKPEHASRILMQGKTEAGELAYEIRIKRNSNRVDTVKQPANWPFATTCKAI